MNATFFIFMLFAIHHSKVGKKYLVLCFCFLFSHVYNKTMNYIDPWRAIQGVNIFMGLKSGEC